LSLHSLSLSLSLISFTATLSHTLTKIYSTPALKSPRRFTQLPIMLPASHFQPLTHSLSRSHSHSASLSLSLIHTLSLTLKTLERQLTHCQSLILTVCFFFSFFLFFLSFFFSLIHSLSHSFTHSFTLAPHPPHKSIPQRPKES
jgi:hypothetical protein